MSEPLEFRPPLDEEEGLRFFQLAARSLLAPVAKASTWLEREGIENARLMLADGQLVAGLCVQRMGQWFGGKSVRCGAVRAVAVAPEARGERVAERMMISALEEMRRDGVALSMLFPATQVLYRRVGYEQAGVWVEQSLLARDFPAHGPALAVREVDRFDPRIRAIYEARMKDASGPFERNEWLWQRVLDPFLSQLDLIAFLLGPEDAPEGYLLVHSERNPDSNEGHLTVRDHALLTPSAVQRARSFLSQHRSMIERVWFTGAELDPLWIGLPNQTAEISRRFGWMLRIVDASLALTARGYAAGLDAEVHLCILDDMLAPREQSLVLRVKGGRGEAQDGGRGSVRIDVRGLAALYSGYLSIHDVCALGYAEGDPASLAALGAIFAGPAPFVCDWV